MTTTGDRRPIGLLLRALDRLIDDSFERALGARAVTRRQWQLLTMLAERPTSLDDLTSAVAPFLDRTGGETAEQHLRPLADDGLVTVTVDLCRLTEPGRALVEDLRTAVQAVRDRTVEGLADGEYDRTVATLQTMVDNLSRPA